MGGATGTRVKNMNALGVNKIGLLASNPSTPMTVTLEQNDNRAINQKNINKQRDAWNNMINNFGGGTTPLGTYTGNTADKTPEPPPPPPQVTENPAPPAPPWVPSSEQPRTPMTTGPTQKDLNSQGTQNMYTAGNVINDNMTGAAFDPYAIQQKQALTRAETNSRAKTAAMINSAGFGGTPIGAGAGNAAEAEILRNRFDHSLNLEVERQNARRQGANMAMEYGESVNRFGMGQEELTQTVRDNAGKNFSDFMATNPGTYYDIANALGDEGKNAAMDNLRNNPAANQALQEFWEANGGTGAYPDSWAWQQIDNYNRNTANKRIMIDGFVADGFTPEEANELATLLVDEELLKSKGIVVTKDENGKYIYETTKQAEDKKYKSGVDNPLTSDNAKRILKEGNKDSEDYKNVISDINKKVTDGEVKMMDVLTNPDMKDYVDDIIAASGSHPDSFGGNYKTSGNDAKTMEQAKTRYRGVHYYPEYEKAFNTGEVIWIGGRPAKITETSFHNKGANEMKTYSILFLDSEGGTNSVTASSKSIPRLNR